MPFILESRILLFNPFLISPLSLTPITSPFWIFGLWSSKIQRSNKNTMKTTICSWGISSQSSLSDSLYWIFNISTTITSSWSLLCWEYSGWVKKRSSHKPNDFFFPLLFLWRCRKQKKNRPFLSISIRKGDSLLSF